MRLLRLLLCFLVFKEGVSTLIDAACRRNPSLKMCEIASQRKKPQTGFILEAAEGSPEQIPYYCHKYDKHFDFFCGKNFAQYHTQFSSLKQFCQSFVKVCRQYRRRDDPLPDPGQYVSRQEPFPEMTDRELRLLREGRSFPDPLRTSVENAARTPPKPKRTHHSRPCTPECDERVFPHCTQECKCDYEYANTQKFCNPPPIPLIYNFCKLWYHKCPKYKRYHYAEQYLISKAQGGSGNRMGNESRGDYHLK